PFWKASWKLITFSNTKMARRSAGSLVRGKRGRVPKRRLVPKDPRLPPRDSLYVPAARSPAARPSSAGGSRSRMDSGSAAVTAPPGAPCVPPLAAAPPATAGPALAGRRPPSPAGAGVARPPAGAVAGAPLGSAFAAAGDAAALGAAPDGDGAA